MDRYDRIIRDIIDKTDHEVILWEAVNPERFGRVLLNPVRVRRAHRAEYPLGDRSYELCFAETKYPVGDNPDNYLETIGYHLYVLDHDGELVLSLYDGVVERVDLYRLAGLIAERNDRAINFFEAFDRSDATQSVEGRGD